MKKNYTLSLFTLLISTILYAQDVVFDFETSQDLLGWEEAGGNIGSASIVAEGLAIDWDGSATTNRKPRIKTLTANVNASIQKYVEISIINNSSVVDRIRVNHFKGATGGDPLSAAGSDTRYTFISVTPGATESYTLDLTDSEWINYDYDEDSETDMDHIWIQLVTATGPNGPLTTDSSVDGNVIIQKISFLENLPSTERTNYTFDNTSDSEGFIGTNGITLSQPTSGEIQLDITDVSSFPKFEPRPGFDNVNADAYKYCQVTLRNNSPKDRLNFVSPEGGNQFIGVDITPDDNTSKLYEIDLNGGTNGQGVPFFTNWTGNQATWALQIVELNPEGGAPLQSAGIVTIEDITFATVSLSTKDITQTTIKLSPNPATDHINISSVIPIKMVEIFNLLGQNVLSETNVMQSIDINSLAQGAYLINIQLINNVRILKKFLKK